MNCGYGELPDNATLCPIAFFSAKPTECRVVLQQYRMRCPQNTTWAREVLPLLFCLKRMCPSLSLVAIISKDYGHVVPAISVSCWNFTNIGCTLHKKTGQDLYIMDWLPLSNNIRNRDQEITGINIYMNAIITSVNIPVCTSIEDTQTATWKDADPS